MIVMIVVFNIQILEALKSIDFSELKNKPVIKEGGNKVLFEFDKNYLLDIKLIINEEISLKGVDDYGAGMVNVYGKQLYYIYDEILYQTK